MGFSMLPEERLLHVHCAKHGCELVENEHYEDWFLGPNFSGFYCPVGATEQEALDEKYATKKEFPPLKEQQALDCSGDWKVSPRGYDQIDVYELIKKAKEEVK